MFKEYEVIEVIRETYTIQVSSRGEGLCLYLPKKFCELYGIIAGHRLKVHFLEHYRLKREEEVKACP